MSNYLFLRGNRNKRFFTDIANELIKKGHHCFQIKFELGELLFKGNIKTTYAHFHLSKEEYPISNEELLNLQIYNISYQERVLNKSIKEKELRIYKRYMYFIDKYIEDNDIGVICLFNGYNWIDQVARVIAKKRGLKTFIFEDGLFRPYTLTCDEKGINAHGSIPREAEFYDTIRIDHNRLKKYLFKPENEELKNRTNENLFFIALIKFINMLGELFRISPRLYTHITLWQGIKYFVFKKTFKLRKETQFEWPKEYIFLPFQVSRDTQIFYNSPKIRTMDELLKIVLKAVEKVNELQDKNIRIIIKEHPEDMSRNNYKELKKQYRDNENIIFIQKVDIKKLIERALAIVTINSTVGIEALAQYKQVITLGEASYNIDGVTTRCKNIDDLDVVLGTVLNTDVNKDRIDKFLYYIRFNYQIEGTINSPSKVTAENVAKRIS